MRDLSRNGIQQQQQQQQYDLFFYIPTDLCFENWKLK